MDGRSSVCKYVFIFVTIRNEKINKHTKDIINFIDEAIPKQVPIL